MKSELASREWLVEVIQDEATRLWVSSCDEIGVSAEAATIEELQKQTLSLVSEMALVNGKMKQGETARVAFVFHATTAVA